MDKCERCGKDYIVNGGNQRFCEDCRLPHTLEYDAARAMPKYEANKDKYNPVRNERRKIGTRHCEYCGNEYLKKDASKTCSEECRRKLRNKKWNERDKKKREKLKRRNARVIPMIGRTYGRLTVIEEIKKTTKERRFLCHCECGNDVPVDMNVLRNGNTQSCGCLKLERVSNAVTKDITGQTFHNLTVLRRAAEPKSKISALWECRCVCGKIVNVTGSNLRSGNTKSCGCLRGRRKSRS
jgi:hypothetical protein